MVETRHVVIDSETSNTAKTNSCGNPKIRAKAHDQKCTLINVFIMTQHTPILPAPL